MLSSILTELPGSSAWFECGFIVYTASAKHRMLGVPMELIQAHGQVSEPVAAAMAEGIFQHSDADIAVSITGIAGPSGGSPDKPVGMVCFGLGKRGEAVKTHTAMFKQADRQGVRQKSSLFSIEALTDLLELAY